MKFSSTIVKTAFFSLTSITTLLFTSNISQAATNIQNHFEKPSFEIAQAQETPEAWGKRIALQCFDNYKNKRYAETIEGCKTVLKILQTGQLPKEESLVLYMLGDSYYELGQYANSIAPLEQSAVLSKRLGLKAEEYKAIYVLGLSHYKQNNLGIAGQYFERSLGMSRELTFQAGEAYSLMMLGYINHRSRNEKPTLQYFEQALSIFQNMKDEKGVTIAKEGISIVQQGVTK